MVVVIMVLMNMLYYYTQSFNIPNKGGERLIDGWSEVFIVTMLCILYQQILQSACLNFHIGYFFFYSVRPS